MHELINTLFDKEMSKGNKIFSSPKLNHYYDRCDKLYEKLRKRLSKEKIRMLDQYSDYVTQIAAEEQSHAFLCGLQTGARLMIELLDSDF